MRIVAKRTPRAYRKSEPRAEQSRKAWYAIASKADWSSPAEVKSVYGNASIGGLVARLKKLEPEFRKAEEDARKAHGAVSRRGFRVKWTVGGGGPA